MPTFHASSWPHPGNRHDRERFAALPAEDQDIVRRMAWQLYDGTRTVARCWKLALDAIEADRSAAPACSYDYGQPDGLCDNEVTTTVDGLPWCDVHAVWPPDVPDPEES